jgi:hypothetical protein
MASYQYVAGRMLTINANTTPSYNHTYKHFNNFLKMKNRLPSMIILGVVLFPFGFSPQPSQTSFDDIINSEKSTTKWHYVKNEVNISSDELLNLYSKKHDLKNISLKQFIISH